MSQFEALAEQLVEGSQRAFEYRFYAEFADFKLNFGRSPTIEEAEGFKNPPSKMQEYWGLGPDGASSIGSDQTIPLADFVGGIALACGIDPTPYDIQTAVECIKDRYCLMEQQNG